MERETPGIDVNLFLQVPCILPDNIISQLVRSHPHFNYSFSLLTAYSTAGFRKISVCTEAELGLDIPTGNPERTECIGTVSETKILKGIFSFPVTSVIAVEIHQVLLLQVFPLRCLRSFITSFLQELCGLQTNFPFPFPE